MLRDSLHLHLLAGVSCNGARLLPSEKTLLLCSFSLARNKTGLWLNTSNLPGMTDWAATATVPSASRSTATAPQDCIVGLSRRRRRGWKSLGEEPFVLFARSLDRSLAHSVAFVFFARVTGQISESMVHSSPRGTPRWCCSPYIDTKDAGAHGGDAIATRPRTRLTRSDDLFLSWAAVRGQEILFQHSRRTGNDGDHHHEYSWRGGTCVG